MKLNNKQKQYLLDNNYVTAKTLDAAIEPGWKNYFIKSFDWELLKNINRPFFLAGGLLPENVKEAVQRLKPFGVDVSSGIETDGHKDASKMGSFVANVRLTANL